jgi:diadenosine tetraphosphate (Ap4A) HIT family hydrolase
LQRRQAAAGYCVAIWKHGHRAEPTELSDHEASTFWLEVLRVGRAIETQFAPIKMNYQTLGNGLPHLHTHLVPRYADDVAPGNPLPFDLLLTAEPLGEEEFLRRVTMLRHAV